MRNEMLFIRVRRDTPRKIEVVWVDDDFGFELAKKRGLDDENDSIFTYVEDHEIERSKPFSTIGAARRWAKANQGLDYHRCPQIVLDGERFSFDDDTILHRDIPELPDSGKLQLHELKRAKGENRFCGPAVISFVLGVSTAEASRMIRAVNGKDRVMGTTTLEVERAFEMQNVSMTEIARYQGKAKPTLAAWLKDTPRRADQMFLLSAGHHWQLIMGRRYACGRIGAIIPLRDKRIKRRARVSTVHLLSRK